MNWITKNIFFGSVPDVVNDGVNFISNQIIKLFDKDIELLTTKEISAAVLATTSVASVLVVVMAFKLIFTTYVTETEGDPDADPIQIWVKVSVVLALINSNDFIYVTYSDCGIKVEILKADAILKMCNLFGNAVMAPFEVPSDLQYEPIFKL